MTYPVAGMVLMPTNNAPIELQNRAFFVFFAKPGEGVMAWDIAQVDDDILFPVLVRRFRLEEMAGHLKHVNHELLNGGPSTLKVGRERDFFILYDWRPDGPNTHIINEQFAHGVLSGSQKNIQQLEDLRLNRFLIFRGFMGFDAAEINEQLNDGWWRVIHVDPDDIFDLTIEDRMARLLARTRLN